MNKFEQNLTQGGVMRQLILFSIPFLLSNFIQAFYNVADMLIVSWYSGPSAVSGVANGGQVAMLVVSFVIGLTVGGTVLVGQFLGAKRRDDIKKTIGTMFTLLIIMAVVLTIISILMTDLILKAINVPTESYQSAKDYFQICMLGTIFIFGYNAVSAVLRGMGDSKRPLYFVSIACVVNVVLDFLFVGAFKMGASGAAIATIIAQAISLLLSIAYLVKNDFIFDFKLSSFRMDKEIVKLLLKIGMPNSFQNVIVSISFLIMMVLVNGYGVYASAALGIVGKFNTFAILPAIAMSASVSSMAAQNLGAGLPDRALKTMYSGIKIVLPVSAVFFLIVLFWPSVVLRIFTDDPYVIEQGIAYIRTFSFDYLVVPFTFCANGLITGAGHTTFTMFNGMLSSVLLRIPIALLFGSFLGWGLLGIGLAAPVASLGALVISLIYIKSGRWTKTNVHTEPTRTG